MTSNGHDDIFFRMDEEPFDKSLEIWSAEWWKWLLSTTDLNNPVNDATGELQSIGQPHANVFFLAGTHVKKAERIVNIPEDRAVFFPSAVMSASFAEFPNLKSEQDLREYAKEGNQVIDMEVTFEGVTSAGETINKQTLDKEDLEKYMVESPLFEVILPNFNIHMYAEGGPTQVVSEGYWVFLKPLERGKYTLTISQNTKDDPTTLTLNCSYVIKYNILVQPKDVTVIRP